MRTLFVARRDKNNTGSPLNPIKSQKTKHANFTLVWTQECFTICKTSDQFGVLQIVEKKAANCKMYGHTTWLSFLLRSKK